MNTRVRYTDLTHVVVNAAGRHGKTKLHTFVWAPDTGEWRLFTPQTSRQRAQYTQARQQLTAAWESDNRMPTAQEIDKLHAEWMPAAGDTRYGDALGAALVDLGEGVTPRGSTLAVIFDALRNSQRSEVDRDAIKVALSKFGGRITGLAELPDELRETAQSLLHEQIVRTLY
jgi:hypothetical protein